MIWRIKTVLKAFSLLSDVSKNGILTFDATL